MNHTVATDHALKLDTSLFFKNLFENAKDACLIIFDENGKILDMNIGLLKTFGYYKEDLINKHISIIFSEDDKKIRRPEIEIATVLQLGSYIDKNFVAHKNGTWIWCQHECILTKNGAGEIFIVKIIQSLHEQKLLEKHLVESYELFEGLIETINHPLVILDNEMRVLTTNKTFYEIFSIDKIPMDQSIFEICPPLSSSKLKDLLLDILPKKTTVTDFEVEYNSPRFGPKKFSLNAMQFKQGGETEPKILISITDITSHAQARTRLQEEKDGLSKINKSLDTFVYSASHDLKAPINNIEALVAHLEDSIDCSGDCINILSMLKESITKFKHTLEDLSKIGKAEEDSKKNISLVEFKEMLEEVKFNLRESIEACHADIRDDFSKAPSINISKNHLRSVLHNLLSNALKYRAPDRIPKITISTEPSDNTYILLKVTDNGLGIKEKDQKKIFSMYKRLHTEEEGIGEVEGTGVGMAIVSRIIENNGGKVEVESEFRKGSTFKIYFKVK